MHESIDQIKKEKENTIRFYQFITVLDHLPAYKNPPSRLPLIPPPPPPTPQDTIVDPENFLFR